MKKTTARKLALQTQTIRALTDESLTRVVGGTLQPEAQGLIMKDSIIVRTSGR